MPGIVVSGVAARALNDLLFAFRATDATAAARALPLRRIGIEPSALLVDLERAGVIKTGDDPASRYLDEQALRAYQTQRRRLPALLAVAAAILSFAIGILAFLVSRR